MISVILPTCHRPQLLMRMLESLRENTRREIELIVLIDEDFASVRIAESFGADVIDFSLKRRRVLDLWNKGLSVSSGWIIHPAMDDLIYHPGWADSALASHEEKLGGMGVVGLNDLAYDGNKQVATQFIFDRRYCKKIMGGVIAPPMYNYLCIDLEINDVANMNNRFYWDKNAIVEHVHSAHGKREYDAHDKWKDENDLARIDGEIYAKRKALGFPVMWEPMI